MKQRLCIIVLFLFSLSGHSQDYSFFIAGHIYGTPGTDSLGFHYPFKEKVPYLQNRSDIEFGIFTGDIVKHPDEEHWDAIDSDIVYLNLPIYFAVGNHEMYDRPLYESRYGDTYYSYYYNNDLFIILDPNIDEWNISGEQLIFLQNTLTNNNSNTNNIFVMFHELLWWDENNMFSDIGINSTEWRADTINFWTEIEPLFHNLNNNVIMCAGDIGASPTSSDVMYYNYDNITFIASGMGEGIGDNFIVINVDSNNISYDLISLNTPNITDMGNLEDYFVDIKPINIDHSISIFPNPSTDFINIISKEKEINKIEIFDIFGKHVYNVSQTDNNVIININTFAKGVYVVNITFTDLTKIRKQIIKF